eukprot:1853525-Rhodomonas_salina.3
MSGFGNTGSESPPATHAGEMQQDACNARRMQVYGRVGWRGGVSGGAEAWESGQVVTARGSAPSMTAYRARSSSYNPALKSVACIHVAGPFQHPFDGEERRVRHIKRTTQEGWRKLAPLLRCARQRPAPHLLRAERLCLSPAAGGLCFVLHRSARPVTIWMKVRYNP